MMTDSRTNLGAPGESPVTTNDTAPAWGSDAIARMLRALDIPWLALNPGASYRGLHDSLVNHLGNERPQMLLCLHEESAVSIAQGYAKASGRMMGAVLHSNVGLMHATMSIFNAWCDRVPMLIIGATGPVDAMKRRPWIDWIHTAADQGALIRDYTKWDDQPASVAAALESLARGAQMARTPPTAPVYVNLDAALQEASLSQAAPLPDVRGAGPPVAMHPDDTALADIMRRAVAAKRRVILMGRVSRSERAWAERIALAERLAARVITDIKVAAAFPTDHRLHAAPPAAFLAPEAIAALRDADFVLALDWVDLAGTLKQAWSDAAIPSTVISVSPDAALHRGWSKDHFGLAPADVCVACEPDVFVPVLNEALRAAAVSEQAAPASAARDASLRRSTEPDAPRPASQPYGQSLTLAVLAQAVNEATRDVDICLTRVPLGWHGSYRDFRHPLDYIGLEGGGGVGAGPGITIGAALALQGTDRLSLAILGDGDFLTGVTALWTAVHYRLPCVFIVANNRSFYNDELHQERVAKARCRPVQNKWIGQRIDDPDIDLAAMARAQGALGIGPLTTRDDLLPAIDAALRHARAGGVAVIDARVAPGYDATPSGGASAATTRGTN